MRIFLISGLLILSLLWQHSRSTENSPRGHLTYWQSQYFSEAIEVENLLALKTRHDYRDDWRGCTFEVVALSHATIIALNSQGPNAISFPNRQRFPTWPPYERWSKTPSKPKQDDAYQDCRDQLPDPVRGKLDRAFSTPGSWSFRDWHSAAILSREYRLAAIFRYGD